MSHLGRVFDPFHPCPLPVLAEVHDNRDLISLTRLPVNNPHPALHKKCPLTMLFMGKIGLFGLEKLSE